MEFAYIKKGFLLKWYKIKIALKRILVKERNIEPSSFSELIQSIKRKEKIVVLASGPSARKLKASDAAFYLVTNDSYKMVFNHDYLYYVKDGYYVNRFMANGPYGEKHVRTLLYWLQEKENDIRSFRFFKKNLRMSRNHELFFFSDLVVNEHSEKDWYRFFDFITKECQLPFKIQNSGVFLLLLGFYLANRLAIPLEIYGLDLGVGGVEHFDKKGHVGDSVTRDDIKRNVKLYLEEIYGSLGKKVTNHSYFFPN